MIIFLITFPLGHLVTLLEEDRFCSIHVVGNLSHVATKSWQFWIVTHGGLYVCNVAGVGGIEAEAVMLGQAISMVLPKVVGYKLTGQVKPFITSTDVVLTITKVSGTMYTVLKQGLLRGAKKIIFTVCHSGKLKLAFTSPNVVSMSPPIFLLAELISQFFCKLNSSMFFLPVTEIIFLLVASSPDWCGW